jgi:hypothetical protein
MVWHGHHLQTKLVHRRQPLLHPHCRCDCCLLQKGSSENLHLDAHHHRFQKGVVQPLVAPSAPNAIVGGDHCYMTSFLIKVGLWRPKVALFSPASGHYMLSLRAGIATMIHFTALGHTQLKRKGGCHSSGCFQELLSASMSPSVQGGMKP